MARRLGWLAATLAAACTAGCGLFGGGRPPPEVPPAPVDVVVVADARLNPDEQGQSLPTVLRIYQLKSAGKLEAADFGPMYRQPKEILGEDLLQADEITLSPGSTVRRRIERDKAARSLALVALFRRPTGLSWRAVAELPPAAAPGEMQFAVEGYRIERR